MSKFCCFFKSKVESSGLGRAAFVIGQSGKRGGQENLLSELNAVKLVMNSLVVESYFVLSVDESVLSGSGCVSSELSSVGIRVSPFALPSAMDKLLNV